jgi:hypothetical protein
MTAATDTSHCFQYVDCDVPDGATLLAWRREQDRERRAEAGRPAFRRPSLRLPSLRAPRPRVRFA